MLERGGGWGGTGPSAPPWASPRLVPGLWCVRAPPALLGVQPTDLRPWDRPRDRGSPQYIPLWGPPGSVSLEDPDSKTPDLLGQGAPSLPAPGPRPPATTTLPSACADVSVPDTARGWGHTAPGLPRLASRVWRVRRSAWPSPARGAGRCCAPQGAVLGPASLDPSALPLGRARSVCGPRGLGFAPRRLNEGSHRAATLCDR